MSRAWLTRLVRGVRARGSLPLLAKELLETAARRRTYVMRVLYALALYAVFVLLMPRNTLRGLNRTTIDMLGSGRQMFETLVALQYFGLALFLPALMCGRITQEKERDSLVLLFLTELRPWSIVLQKYLGGLVLMLSFFLLGLPLAGVAYAFGGLESHRAMVELLGLFLMCLQVGALALFCSAWCRSTVGSFIMTYLLGVVFYAGPPLSWLLLTVFCPSLSSWSSDRFVFLLVPPAVIEMNLIYRPVSAADGMLWLAPSVASIFFFLILARGFLVRRALTPSVNFLRPLFQRIDRTMKRLNRATGGVVLWRDSTNLPGDEPIFWRETHQRVLGKPHYLMRLLFVVETPLVLLCTGCAFFQTSYREELVVLSVIIGVLSALAALLVSVHAANTIVSERVGQTLEVLLTTPLSAREIVRQKERALRRLQFVVAIPLLTVFAIEAYAEAGSSGSIRNGGPIVYFLCSALMVVIYLPMITWLSLWISLRVRTRFQAIIGAVGLLTLWTALSPLLFFVADESGSDHAGWWRSVVLLSPVSVGFLNEFSSLPWSLGNPWLAASVNAALYATIALLIRWRLFADAESLLRR